MNVTYTMSRQEFDLMSAMASGGTWQGETAEYEKTIRKLLAKGYLTDTGGEYLLDAVIAGILGMIADTPEDRIFRREKSTEYRCGQLCVLQERDKYAKNGICLRVCPAENGFPTDEENIEKLESENE